MPFEKHICELQWRIVLDGVLMPKIRFEGRTLNQSMQLQIAAKLSIPCCHLANAKQGERDSAFAKLH